MDSQAVPGSCDLSLSTHQFQFLKSLTIGSMSIRELSWIEGKTLNTVWRSLNDIQKFYIAEQLKGYISELRSLPQPQYLSG